MSRRVACAAALFAIWGWISPLQALAQFGGLVVTMTSPTSGSTVAATVTVSASVSIIGFFTVEGVQFQLDGANLGAEDTTAPYSVPWNTTTTSNGSHALTAIARDAFGIHYTSDPVTVTVSNPPTITSFTPTSGPVGTSVTISGTNFTGATTVTFNGVSASFTVSSATAIQATVPPGATTGPLSVTTPGGTATTASAFTVVVSATGGDVFVALDHDGTPPDLQGAVQWRNSDGSLRRILTGASKGQASSVNFDAAGNIYVPHWCVDGNCFSPNNTVERFDANGNFLASFGSGYNCNPSSMAFDPAGNMYVGQADCTGNILKFNAAGTLVDAFTVATEVRGTDHIDLTSDGCTIFYTSRGKNVLRYNVCTKTQLPQFNTQPLPGDQAYHLRVLPDGGVLVANGFSVIVRLDASGHQIQTYFAPGETNYWGGVDLVGDGTFWATNAWTDNVYKFDLTSGAILASFNTGTGGLTAAGVGVRR